MERITVMCPKCKSRVDVLSEVKNTRILCMQCNETYMAYEMLAEHQPFESANAAVLKQAVLDETPEEISDVPKNVREAIKRAMSK